MPQDMQYLLGEMNAKLDTLVHRAEEDRSAGKALADRVKKLEEFRWRILGACLAVSACVGFLLKLA